MLPVRAEKPFNLYGSKFLAETRDTPPSRVSQSGSHIGLHHTTDYATVLLPLPGIYNDLEVVRRPPQGRISAEMNDLEFVGSRHGTNHDCMLGKAKIGAISPGQASAGFAFDLNLVHLCDPEEKPES